jgi:hypothetical protein
VVLVGVYVGAIYRPKGGATEREPDANAGGGLSPS